MGAHCRGKGRMGGPEDERNWGEWCETPKESIKKLNLKKKEHGPLCLAIGTFK